MANSLSAEKRIRQNEKKRKRNKAHKTRLRNKIKSLKDVIEEEHKKKAKEMLPETFSIIDKSVQKGVLHENAAARHKSRLSKKVQEM